MKVFLISISLLSAVFCQAQTSSKLFAETQALYDSKDYVNALAKADELIELTDTMASAFKLRGDIKQRIDDFEGALADYNASKDINNDDPRLYISRSAARISMGNFNGAVRDLERAIKLDPQDADARFNLACTNYMNEDFKGAMKELEATLALDPNHADALFMRGLVRGEEYEEAAGLEDIERALELKPEIQGGQISAAILLYELKQYQAAADRFTKVLEDSDSETRSDALYYRAECYYNLDQKEKACKDFKRAARFGDTDAPIVIAQYCETDARRIKNIPKKKKRDSSIQF